MTTWSEIFDPVLKSDVLIKNRPQQEVMGQAVIDSIKSRTNLIVEAPTGTGKSLAALIPIINWILRENSTGRAVISTATRNLQDQYMEDLSRMKKIYGDNFSFCSLKGRDNYLCWNQVKTNMRGSTKIITLSSRIEKLRHQIKTGERGDIERILKEELSDYDWSFLSGSVKNCGENKCTSEECYSARARSVALQSNIIITNNAVIRVDAETRGDDGMTDPFLGDIDILVVDEAHELEASLISGWTEEFSEWDLNDLSAKVLTAIDDATYRVQSNPMLAFQMSDTVDNLSDFLKSVIKFYGMLHDNEPWNRVYDSLCMKYIKSNSGPGMISAMAEFEDENPVRIEKALKVLEEAEKYLKDVYTEMVDTSMKGTRKISKGRTAIKTLKSVLTKINDALGTSNGVLVSYGVPYLVGVEGIIKRDGKHSVKLSVTPMDISEKAQSIWKDRTCVLMSATLKDLTSGNFKFLKTSLGFEARKEVQLDTVFDLKNKQLTYITPASYTDIAQVPGARYSRTEMVELIHAANGRTLVLFTSRMELDDAADYLTTLSHSGKFPYHVLVQTQDVNKTRLSDEFKQHTNSVLLATKSFFQGFNAPGETLSMVILPKYPLPQYSILAKNQIQWWKSRGFPEWYSAKSMEVFHQAAGRVIRTESDYGVVALIDQRVIDPKQSVCTTALTAVNGLGSPVIRDIDSVRTFLAV